MTIKGSSVDSFCMMEAKHIFLFNAETRSKKGQTERKDRAEERDKNETGCRKRKKKRRV